MVEMKRAAILASISRNSQLIVTISMLVLLVMLAALQYHWLGQLSERERDQMRSHLNGIAVRFREDFDSELMRTISAFDINFEPRDQSKSFEDATLEGYVERYQRWRNSAPHPGLVSAIEVALANNDGLLTLHEMTSNSQNFEKIDWPSDLKAHRDEFEAQIRRSREGPPPQQPPPDEGPPPGIRRGPGDGRGGGVIEQPLALVARIVSRGAMISAGPPLPPQSLPPRLLGFAIVRLNQDFIKNEMLPELVQRDFGGADSNIYDLMIVSRREPDHIVYEYRTEPVGSRSRESERNPPDVRVGLLSMPGGPGPRRPPPPFRTPPDGPPRNPGFRGPRPDQDPGIWELQLRHQAGSLEAAVSRIRRRNLIVSFSILGLLAASVAMLIASNRRARRLARQQMDFVAGVSHELRTPLAVIETAAYNLDKGIIRTEQQTRAYGAMIRKESTRLRRMVEQMLEYAGVQAGRVDYVLTLSDVNNILNEALASSQPLIAEGGFKVEAAIDEGLPLVAADPPALARALENLISNAMKYGGSDKWIGVRAFADRKSGTPVIKVEVSDHGSGIALEELEHIFEPFFRGNEARSRQIRGNGLGLSIVNHIVAAHGGTVRVESTSGTGTTFIVTLPVAVREATSEHTATLPDYEQANTAG